MRSFAVRSAGFVTSRALLVSVNNRQYIYFPVGTHTVFGQASIGVEFGTTPWARASFRAPRKAVAVASFDRPTPPPYWAELAPAAGRRAGSRPGGRTTGCG
jgi:hypothetical protein